MFGLFIPTISSDGGGSGGSETVITSYSLDNVVIIMIGTFIPVVGMSF